jgi:hypothetical protein
MLTIMSVTVTAGLLAGLAVLSQNQAVSQEPMKIVSRDSVTVLLDHTGIPPKDFIHLYDATPYMIMNGHIATKLPCDANSESPLKVVVGQAPDVQPVELEVVPELSSPGSMCIYHVDLPPAGIDVVTDIALLNPTDEGIRLPRTSTIVIGVNEIEPLGEHDEHSEHG